MPAGGSAITKLERRSDGFVGVSVWHRSSPGAVGIQSDHRGRRQQHLYGKSGLTADGSGDHRDHRAVGHGSVAGCDKSDVQ